MFFRRRKPDFRGHIDGFKDGVIYGWVQDRQHPKTRQIVEILYAGAVIGSVPANQFRSDLKNAGIAQGDYGFSFKCPVQIKNVEAFSARVSEGNYWLLNDIPSQLLGEGAGALINKPRRGLPILRPGLSLYEVNENDIEIAEEICLIWKDIKQKNPSSFSSDPGSMWAHIIGERHKGLIHFLDQSKPRDLAEYLINIHKKPESSGLFQGDQAYHDFIAATPEGRWSAVVIFQDMLASLSQYLGVFNLECDEQDAQGEAVSTQTELLIKLIEEKLGFEIVPKNIYDGLYGLRSYNNIIHGRDIQALYLALRQSEILQNKTSRICEIGAGFGLGAYYAWLMGCANYFIIDLPTVCILQYFTLRRLLPETKIEILREGQTLSPISGISIIPAGYANELPNFNADLIVNVDSFPEMGKEICNAYFNKIPEWSTQLLSINQEANREITGDHNRQTIVSSMLSEAGYHRLYRFRSWIRQGYAEELWHSPITAQQ